MRMRTMMMILTHSAEDEPAQVSAACEGTHRAWQTWPSTHCSDSLGFSIVTGSCAGYLRLDSWHRWLQPARKCAWHGRHGQVHGALLRQHHSPVSVCNSFMALLGPSTAVADDEPP